MDALSLTQALARITVEEKAITGIEVPSDMMEVILNALIEVFASKEEVTDAELAGVMPGLYRQAHEGRFGSNGKKWLARIDGESAQVI